MLHNKNYQSKQKKTKKEKKDTKDKYRPVGGVFAGKDRLSISLYVMISVFGYPVPCCWLTITPLPYAGGGGGGTVLSCCTLRYPPGIFFFFVFNFLFFVFIFK